MTAAAGAADDPDRRAAALREVALPRGSTLVIRRVAASDVDALEALYAGFDDDSVYRRFFSLHHPGREFFERMAAAAGRGGAELVATVQAPGGEAPELVAEAGFEPLPNGDGELAITVAPAWRGWLGPYLLDALVEEAARMGVANLEADVLSTNEAMLGLLRARGCIAMPRSDWTVVRVLVGTYGRTPRWPDTHHRIRVLVEGDGGGWTAGDAAVSANLEVLRCAGPDRRVGGCPVLRGERCPLADEADVVVRRHPTDDEGWEELRGQPAGLGPGVPIGVELRPGDTARPGEEPAPSSGEVDVVAFVQRLARHTA